MPTQRQLNIIERAARRYDIAPRILYGLWGAESNFGQNTGPSSAGAIGDFQFMPATAQGMGVNPYKFRSAAFGAARYLSQYKDRGVRGMLAAYNAGPAGNPNNPETRAYIPKVLQLARQFPGGGGGGGGGGTPADAAQMLSGASPASALEGGSGSTLALLQALQAAQGGSQPSSGGLAPPAHSAAPVLPQGARAAVSGGGPAAKPDVQALMAAIRTVGGGLPGVPDTGGGGLPGQQRQADGRGPKVKGPLREMFLNVKGAVNVDEGKRVGLGFVSGHTTHAHVAGNPRDVDRLGRLAQRMGLTVKENETFDPVDRVHTKGSFHYRDMAIDVSGPMKKLLEFNRRVARAYGV